MTLVRIEGIAGFIEKKRKRKRRKEEKEGTPRCEKKTTKGRRRGGVTCGSRDLLPVVSERQRKRRSRDENGVPPDGRSKSSEGLIHTYSRLSLWARKHLRRAGVQSVQVCAVQKGMLR